MRLRRTGESVGIEGLEEVIVRVTTAVALGFLALLLVAGTITGDSRFFMQAINPAAPGLVGIVMLVSGNVRALLQLAAGGGAIALTTGVLDVGSRSGALLGLVSMAIVGALLVRRQVVAFIVGASFALFAISYWWNAGGWGDRERLIESLAPGLAFALAAGLVTWLKRESLLESDRRRAAVHALLASEKQFRTAFDASATTMALVGIDDGRLLRVNPAACEMLGYREEELLGMTVFDITHPDDRAAARTRIEGALSGEQERSQDTLKYLRRDGSVAFGLVSLALVTDAAGEPVHFVASLVDLTEQHAAEQRLVDLLGSRDELIASVSHELRTPLTAVLGYASLLVESAEQAPPDGYRDMLQEIVDQGSDLVAIIEDLLVFAQSDANSLAVNHEIVDIRDQVNLVIESLTSQVPVKQIQVVGPAIAATADPLRVRQVLRNLLSNAGRYGGDSIVVELGEAVGDGVRVVVADNGSGIPQQDRDRIFEPYQRSKPEDGLTAAIGVGLTVARRLARLMDGELTYERRGGLSRFELSLPSAQLAPAEVNRRPASLTPVSW